MKSKVLKASVIVATTCALLIHSGGIINPLPVVSAATTSIVNQSVKLNSTSTIKLLDAQFLMQDQGRILAFTFQVTNNGNRELLLADYWVRVKSTSGKTFAAKIADQDKNIRAVAPNSSRTLTYYTTVDKTTKLPDLIFEIIEWDFNATNYERRLGSIQYPKGSSELTPLNQEKIIQYGNLLLSSKINTYTLTSDANNAYLQVNYSIKNNGFNNVELNKLDFYIQTTGLAVYPVTLNATEGSPLRAGEQRLITLNIVLPKNLIGSTLTLVAASKDESSGTALPLASLRLPGKADTTLTGINKVKMTYVNGQQVNTFLDSVQLSKVMDKTTINFSLALRNLGKEAVDYPNFSFSLITRNGVTYPLNYTKSSETTNKLLPQLREVVQINGELPLNIDLTSAKLLVRSNASEGDTGYVVGSYLFQTTQQSGTIGSSYKYGNYEIKLDSIERVASTDQDMLVADLVITNKGSESESVPLLGGYFMLNGVKLNAEAVKVVLDNKSTLGVNQSTNIVVYAPISYTADVKNISFVLLDQSGGEAAPSKQIYQYSSAALTDISLAKNNDAYTTVKEGQRTKLVMKQAKLYKTEVSEYYYVEFDATNLESRTTTLSKVGGYLTNETGEIVPVTFANKDTRIRSNGKVLLTGWAKLPRNFDTENVEFIFGLDVQPGSQQEGNEPQIIIKPVKYQLQFADSHQVTGTLKDISIAGHELSLAKVNATLYVTGMFTVSGLKLQFDYSLEKDSNYDLVTGDHKLLIEFVDKSSGNVSYSKEFELAVGQSDETTLKVGNDIPLEVIFEDMAIQGKIQNYDKYQLNIYDVFQGAKILVASKELRWFQPE